MNFHANARNVSGAREEVSDEERRTAPAISLEEVFMFRFAVRFSPLALALTTLVPSLDAGELSFDHDHKRALDVAPSEVTLRNISYVRGSGERAEAIVVTPAKPGRYPGVLFVHWYGEPFQTSNRTQFVPDAMRLARQGFVSLLVDTMWSEPTWFNKRKPADDLSTSVAQVKELRRSLDLLASLAAVDPERVAYVGHDFGAMYGTVVAAVDKRPKAFVFIAGTTAFADWFLLGRKLDAEAQKAVREELAPLDPVRHIGKINASSVLFQFAKKDEYVPQASADALVAAAREPKTVKFYECGHEMNGEAMVDRVDWLVQRLGPAK